MSYTLTSTSRAAYRGGVDTSTAYAGYEITPKLSRVVRYTFTAPAQGVSALSFSVANVARAYKYNNFNGIRFAVTTSDASHRNAVEAGGFEGHAAPVAGNGTSYTVSGSCEVNIAPGAAFYLWFFPAEYAHCLWSFANLGSFTVTCEAGAASFASIDSAVETLGTLSASAGTATAAMTHRLTLCAVRQAEAVLFQLGVLAGIVIRAAGLALRQAGQAVQSVRRAIFAAYPPRTALALTARLQAYSDAACTMPYGAPAEAAVSVTADAGMAPKLPAAAVTSSIVNSGTVAAAATGQSRVRFRLDSTKFDFSDAPGASAASVTVNGTALAAPAYEYLSPVLTANSTKFNIVLTDTRGRRAALSRTVTAQSYAPPSITAVTAQRCDSAGAADESGKYVKLSASVVYSALGGANAVSLSAAWRYRGGSYGAETALTSDTAKLLGGALDPDKTLELRITATDGFGQSALRTESLAGRRWAMKLRPDGLGVGFGMSPQEGSALELPDGWRVLIGGRSAAEQAWPVGAVFWTPEATNPAPLLGFGTWSRVNSALPAAWKRDE